MFKGLGPASSKGFCSIIYLGKAEGLASVSSRMRKESKNENTVRGRGGGGSGGGEGGNWGKGGREYARENRSLNTFSMWHQQYRALAVI